MEGVAFQRFRIDGCFHEFFSKTFLKETKVITSKQRSLARSIFYLFFEARESNSELLLRTRCNSVRNRVVQMVDNLDDRRLAETRFFLLS